MFCALSTVWNFSHKQDIHYGGARQTDNICFPPVMFLKVANNDEDISILRELVHTETLRAEHASRILAKYVKRAVAADQAAGSSDGNGGLKTGPRSRESILQDSSRRATSRAR